MENFESHSYMMDKFISAMDMITIIFNIIRQSMNCSISKLKKKYMNYTL